MKKIFTLFAAMLLAVTASATTPETNFEAPGYALSGTAATLDEGLLKETHFGEDRAYIRYDGGNHGYAAASWTINVTRGCYVTAKVFTADNSWQSSSSPWGNSGHSFGVELWNEDKTQRLDTIAEGPYALSGDGNRNYPAEGIDLNNKGILLIPTAGVYTFKLLNPRYWSRCGVDSVLITYYADAPTEIIPVSSVTLNKTEVTLDLQEVEQLTATVDPDNATDRTVNWTSDNTSVATVNANGLVTAGEAGTAIITCKAQADETKFATCTVTVAAASIPEVEITSTYTLEAKVAHLEGNIGKKYEGEKYKIYGKGIQHCGNAFWTIHVTNPCILSASIMNANGDGAGSLYELDVFKGGDSITTIIQPSSTKWYSGIIDMTGTITLAEAADYTFRLRNTQEYSVGKTSGISLTKETEPIDIYLKAGVWHDAGAKFGVYDRGSSSWWPEFMENVEGDLYVFRNFPANKVSLNFVRLKNTTVAPGNDDDIWNQVVEKTRTNDNNYFKISDWSAGDWRKYFPGFDAGYYLVGTHNSWEPKAADILAKNGEEEEYMITKNAEEGDQFKAIRIDTEGLNAGWYPDGSDNEYTIPEELAGNVTIYFRPDGNNEWPDTNGGGKKFYVVRNGDPTAIDNTVVGEKAVKLMENGQIVIIKNGVRYNVLGTVIK